MAKKKEEAPQAKIRVKALQTCYYDDGLRMPGSVFDIRGEQDFNPKAMKKVTGAVRLTSTPVSDSLNNKRLPPGPVLSEAEQELEEDRLAAETASDKPEDTVI